MTSSCSAWSKTSPNTTIFCGHSQSSPFLKRCNGLKKSKQRIGNNLLRVVGPLIEYCRSEDRWSRRVHERVVGARQIKSRIDRLPKSWSRIRNSQTSPKICASQASKTWPRCSPPIDHLSRAMLSKLKFMQTIR